MVLATSFLPLISLHLLKAGLDQITEGTQASPLTSSLCMINLTSSRDSPQVLLTPRCQPVYLPTSGRSVRGQKMIPKGAIMRIRDLGWRGEAVWPPEWWPPEDVVIITKNGLLKEVGIQNIGRQYIQVKIETPKGPFWGVILLEEPGHLQILCQKLKENIGKTVTEIGELEIDQFLSFWKRSPKQARPHRTPAKAGLVSNKK